MGIEPNHAALELDQQFRMMVRTVRDKGDRIDESHRLKVIGEFK